MDNSPNDKIISMKLGANSSQNYYKNFLNQAKDDELTDVKLKASITNKMKETSVSPNGTMDDCLQSDNTMREKKDSFIRVEEFRKSKQFRESKIPTNTSFSGIDKSNLQNLGLKNYETRKNQYQSKNKSFDLISYHSKRKSKFTKRNNIDSFYYNVNELLKNAATSNSKTIKSSKKKKTMSDSKNGPLRSNTFNKRQRFNQSKLYQRRSVTTTRGTDISPQIKTSIKSDIQRPTSSSCVEGYKRNNWLKESSKNDNMMMKSNPLDLYDLKDNSGKNGNKKAFSFVTNTKKSKKSSSSNNPGKRNSSRKSNGYSKKSHSFSMTKKFKGLQKI